MKKAQDFLLDSALGEKKFDLTAAAATTPPQGPAEDKIVLSIDEGALPMTVLKDVKKKVKVAGEKNALARLNEYLRTMGKPTPRDKATFFRLMSIMISAGVSLVKALDTIAEQTLNQKLKTAVTEIARLLEKGGTLSESMSRYPQVFSDAHIGMIRSGEASGQLNQILKQLAIEVEKSAAIISKVKGAMMYPAFIITVMILVVAAMMVFVVPKISAIFAEGGQELPTLTKIVIAISDFMRTRWPFIFGGIIGVVFAVIGARRTAQGKVATDWALLHIPLFGDLLKKSLLARFSRSLGNLLSSGIPIIQSLHINAKALGNEIYKKRVELASEDIARGIPLGESLRDSPEFPTMMVQMISIGEQTAQLDTITGKIAEYYEDEIDTTVASISKVLEPVILVVVGVVVGAIVGAVMMPIIQLAQVSGV